MQIGHTAAMQTFALAGGDIFHLNVMAPMAVTTLTGSCGSACGSGNPSVQVSFNAADSVEPFTAAECPSGWDYEGVYPDPSCSLVTNANTVLNASPVGYFTLCDGYAPGNQPGCSDTTFTISITVIATGLAVFSQTPQDCECLENEVEVNQKYYVTSNNFANGPEGYGWWGLGAIFGNYEWIGTGLQQFCTSVYIPDLYYYGNTVTVIYTRRCRHLRLPEGIYSI